MRITKPDWSFIAELEPVLILHKKRSRHCIEYYIDPDDSWFLYVVERVRKDGSIKRASMILRCDIPVWYGSQLRSDWVPDREYNF